MAGGWSVGGSMSMRESSSGRLMRRDFRKVRSLRVKGPAATSCIGFGGVFGLFFDFVEADGGFEHEQDVEALLADVLDDACDVFRFGDGLVDGFAKLLDQVLYLLIQCHLRAALSCDSSASGIPGPARPAGTALRSLRSACQL